MTEQTIQRINLTSFIVSLVTIGLGVVIGIFGVWGVIPNEDGLFLKILTTDAIVFIGAVLTNLAIACYRKPGGELG